MKTIETGTGEGYEALHRGLTIQASPIHGLGVFAVAEINALEFLGISHIADSSGRYHCDYIRTPIGAYINHSHSPNCAKVAVGGGDDSHRLLEDGETSSLMGIQASRDILAGEELTVFYTIYKAPWTT